MYKRYLDNEQMNFQINRFLEPYYSSRDIQEEIEEACQGIRDLETWYIKWTKLANSKYMSRQYRLASAYFQLSDFFLEESDPRKNDTYSLFRKSFYKSISNFPIKHVKVPYENVFLPAAIVKKESATDWLVFHGGFDSYLEELILLSITYLGDLKNYNIITFEGPGQGELLKESFPMTYEWEKPVAALLNFFDLDNVTLLGMSMGGYLALRAASKEERIKKVIAFDTFYSMEDAFLMNKPKELSKIPNLEDSHIRQSVDNLITNYSEKDIDFKFKINKSKEIFGKNTPSEVLRLIKKYTLSGLEDKINQDVLLLAGTKDMYVPAERISFLAKKLINASSVKSILFNEQTGGQYHCQVGNKSIAFKEILRFLY